MKILIGWDPREERAFDAARRSAYDVGCHDVSGIYGDRLREAGMLYRSVDRRDGMWDLTSNAPQSTDFAISRFFTPLMVHSGWCLFVDADVVFLDRPSLRGMRADPSKAVMVVKHPPLLQEGMKMDHAQQTIYRRKNWSSVILWNCGHHAHKRLNLMTLNHLPGRDLHGFCWLADSEIGELDERWNWLVNVREKPDNPGIAHFTLGGPWIPGWRESEHDFIWTNAHQGRGNDRHQATAGSINGIV